MILSEVQVAVSQNWWLVSTDNKNYNYKNLNITNLYKVNEVLRYNNDFLYPSNNKIYGKNLDNNKTSL